MAKTDVELLTSVTELWGSVQLENRNDQSLVTDEEWNQWKAVDNSVSAKLLSIVDGFFGTLSEADRSYLMGIEQQVASVKRLTWDELLIRRLEDEAAEELKEELRSKFTHE